MNLILAILQVKGVISTEEAERIAEYMANAPQPYRYSEALREVKNLTEQIEEK